MSQQFQVLKCFKCCTFQVHQVKKSIKWECKMCGEKQSVKRNYGTGTGKECRLHVQKLNSIRGEISESLDSLDTLKFENEGSDNSESWRNTEKSIPSKWAQYVESETEPQPNLPEVSAFRGAEVVLELPKNPARKRLNKTIHSDCGKRLKPLNPDPDRPETLNVSSNDNHANAPASTPFFDELPNTSNLNDGKADNESTVFEPCKLSKNSKWAKFVDENVEMEEIEIDRSSDDACEVLEHPKVAKDSKWSQYVENKIIATEEKNYESRVLTSGNTVDVKGISFSQCSDEDFDRILDF